MKHHKQNANTGFTILELLVVIAIIGVLIAIFVVSQTTARNKAHNATVLLQIEEYVKALELYHTNYGVYPSGGSNDSLLQRSRVFCIYDGHSNGQHCMPHGDVPTRQSIVPNDSLVRDALKTYMSALPKIEHAQSNGYASPAYSGCIYPVGGGPASSCDSAKDYSFWFLLRGVGQDCGRSDVVQPNVGSEGTTTLCRRQSSIQ